MKHPRIIESWDKIEPSRSAHDRMLSAVLEQNRLEHERKEKVKHMDKSKKSAWVKWGAVAACLCLVIGGLAVLCGKKAATPIPIQDLSGVPVTESTEQSGDYAPMIVVGGTTYRDTFKQYDGAIDSAAIQRSTSYVDGYPAQDGEQNFYRDNTDYILLNDGTVICRIDGGWRVFEPCASADGQRNERDVEEPTVDVPVDESTYSEARVYSGDILDLQNRISAAMTNHELPFVTTSAILENPDRIHVTVTTTDEDAIALLKSFDTTGKLLEIEYVTGTAAAEEAAIIDNRG